jgi:hypothetical protein
MAHIPHKLATRQVVDLTTDECQGTILSILQLNLETLCLFANAPGDDWNNVQALDLFSP